jgi:glycosyltransferase involved in cell wall biosynthesis
VSVGRPFGAGASQHAKQKSQEAGSVSRYSLADLTVVVPAKDAQNTLGRTLASLSSGMAQGMRCMLIDDGSTDTTTSIMSGFADRWPTASFVRFEESQGAGRARNFGIGRTETAFVGTLDADDWVHADYYRGLIRRFDDVPEVEFIRTSYLECHEGRRKLVTAPFSILETPFDPQLAILPIEKASMVDHPQMWAGVYSTDFLNDNGIRYDDLHTAEDRIVNWKTQVLGRSMIVADECRIFYRKGNAASLTAIGDDRQLDFVSALQNVVAFLMDAGGDVFMAKAVRQVMSLICFHLQRKDRLLPETRDRLFERSRRLLALLPAGELDSGLAAIDEPRRKLLKGFL